MVVGGHGGGAGVEWGGGTSRVVGGHNSLRSRWREAQPLEHLWAGSRMLELSSLPLYSIRDPAPKQAPPTFTVAFPTSGKVT